jgi:hypothetical protein
MMPNGQEDKNMVKIEKEIPIPTIHHLQKYPFLEMEVGDSIFLGDYKHARGAQQSAYLYGRKLNRKFISRKEDDGLRI